MVGQNGHVTSIDMTPEMLEKARAAMAELELTNVDFLEGEIERLPLAIRKRRRRDLQWRDRSRSR